MNFPKYLSTGRLVLLSKDNKPQAQIDNTRPIVVNSHITKVIEKAILIRLRKLNSKLLDTDKYQTGFKEGNMTHFNLARVFESIVETRMKRKLRKAYVFVDLKKAYDSVDRCY